MRLDGRVALVTGAGIRLGRAIALELGRAGCGVAVHFGRSEADARETAREIAAAGARSATFQADLTDPDQASALPGRVIAELGRLDVVVNSAAVMEPGTLEETTVVAWDRALDLNLRAPFLIVQAAAEELRRRGGRVVNVADAAAYQAWSAFMPLSVSKAGVVMLTKCLAKALAPEVCVNAVAPGPVLMPAWADADHIADAEGNTVLGRLGSPEDVAGAVRFLLEGGDYITGATIPVDGGRVIR